MVSTRRRSSRKAKSDDEDYSDVIKGFDSIDDLQRSLKSGGGKRDPEILLFGDQDVAQVAFVSVPKQWREYKQHYVQGQGYKMCRGEGCVLCDAGLWPSRRMMVGVYVKMFYQAERKDFKAKRTKDVGYRYMPCSKEFADILVNKAKRRRGTMGDSYWEITRIGDDTDTKYDIDEVHGSKPTRQIMNGWKDMDITGKIIGMIKADLAGLDSGGSGKKKKVRDDYDEDDEDYDYDDDDDDTPRRGRSARRSSTRRSRR